MVGLYFALPTPVLVPKPYNCIGAILAAGLLLSFAGARQFARRGTNIKTFDDPDVLVTEGLFRFSRNPMYLGFVLFLAGAAIYFGTLASFIVAVAFAVITDRWYIRFEEQAMRRKFGAAYAAYAASVRRWL
jgi:protein-S-isoprenylcysteine O-methyltransferase Ste14